MASYEDLFPLRQHSEFRNKITVAVGVAAELIRLGTDTGEAWDVENHNNRLIWAARAYMHPMLVAREIQWSIIITNRASTIEDILAVSDVTLQNNVNATIDIFATGN